MQHIGVVHKEEGGETISEFPGGLPPAIIDAIPEGSTCLGFIDEYGDTMFNHRQLPVLIAELEALVVSKPKLRVEPLVQYLRSCQGLHTYVHFIGD